MDAPPGKLDCSFCALYMGRMNEEILRIRRALTSGLIVRGKLANEADVHRNTIRRAANSGWSPTARTVQKIIDALDRIGA